jgi:hypothetical protein
MLTDRNFDYRNVPQDADAADMPGRPESPFAIVPPNTTFGGGSGHHGGNDACRLVMANLSAYLDNELDPDQERVIEGHLSQCAECASNLSALRTTDRLLQREWRGSAPLPSSLDFKQSVDAIMAALPPVPGEQTPFAPKRVHSRARWMRFSTGLAGVIAFFAMLCRRLHNVVRIRAETCRFRRRLLSCLLPAPSSQTLSLLLRQHDTSTGPTLGERRTGCRSIYALTGVKRIRLPDAEKKAGHEDVSGRERIVVSKRSLWREKDGRSESEQTMMILRRPC